MYTTHNYGNTNNTTANLDNNLYLTQTTSANNSSSNSFYNSDYDDLKINNSNPATSASANSSNNANSRMSQQHQQNQKIRNSFFRANRPGDLNLNNTHDLNESILSPQSQQQTQILYKTNNNYKANYQAASPHCQQQQQQQQQHSQLSPSPSYNNIQQNSNVYQQPQQNLYSPTLPNYKNNINKASYTPLGPPPTLPMQHSQSQIPTTPNYSPSYNTSAHMVKSNQSYLNFDFPTSQQQQQRQYNQIPQSPVNFQQHVQQTYTNTNQQQQQQNYLQRMNSSTYQQQNPPQSPLNINMNQQMQNQNTVQISPHFVKQNQIIQQQQQKSLYNNPPQSPIIHNKSSQQQNAFNFSIQHHLINNQQQNKLNNNSQSVPNSPATTTTTNKSFQFNNNTSNVHQNLQLKQNIVENNNNYAFHGSIDNNNNINCLQNFNFNNSSNNSNVLIQSQQQESSHYNELLVDSTKNESDLVNVLNNDNSTSSIDNIDAILQINENNVNMTVNTPPPTNTDNLNIDSIRSTGLLMTTNEHSHDGMDVNNNDVDDINDMAPGSNDNQIDFSQSVATPLSNSNNNNNIGRNTNTLDDINIDNIDNDNTTTSLVNASINESSNNSDLYKIVLDNHQHQKEEYINDDESNSLKLSKKKSVIHSSSSMTKQGHLKGINKLNTNVENNNTGNISAFLNNQLIQSCNECGKTFSNKSALAKHRLIHSNERKYSCGICDKSFKRQDHLNGHLLTHQEKKPFECKVPNCEKSYCDSRSLKRHIESQHQDFLALLAQGNTQALNYLPRIGKLKASLGPNMQQTIVIDETQIKTENLNDLEAATNLSNKRFQEILSDVLSNQYKNSVGLIQGNSSNDVDTNKVNDNANNNQVSAIFPQQKNYFT